MNTLRFDATIGVTPGYGHQVVNDTSIVSMVRLWKHLMEEERRVSGIYVPAVINKAIVAYGAAEGCPEDGEIVLTITGDRNPMRESAPPADWRQAVVRIMVALRAELKQTTCQVCFTETDMVYIR